MPPLIALWVHPRSMSTAMERIMRERGDMSCFHEPFLNYFYGHRKVRILPHFEPDPALPETYEDTRDMLVEAARAGPVFFKDMSYYVIPEILDDRDFFKRVTHTFLIRHPLRSIVSYHKLDPELIQTEVGLEAQWQHAEAVAQTTGRPPVVLLAEEVQNDPAKMLRAYWEAIGLPPKEEALSWDREKTPEDWGPVAGWHGSVADSQGIRPLPADDAAERQAAFEKAAETAPRLRDLLDHHLPYYEKLKALALRDRLKRLGEG